MERSNFIDQLFFGFKANGLENYLSAESAEKLYLFAELLVEANRTRNLTAITDEEGIILKHFIDSASVLPYIPAESSIIDIGCGAGFPSLPIAILRNDVKITPIDSTGKKIDFVNATANALSLNNIKAVCARAEALANVSRETFDVCVSRAVARLNILSELCVPFVRVGGVFVAMKSNKGEEEYSEALQGLKTLGCELENKTELSLSHKEQTVEREIYVFRKRSQTPKAYPRNYSQICKKPL